MLDSLSSGLRLVGNRVVNAVWRIGFAARFFIAVLMYSGTSFRRFNLTIREIYFTGVLSLIIILISGLFVGMVLGLQGYDTLQRYGASEALGVLVALSLVRELGPVIAALLFASRAGSAMTAEIGQRERAKRRRERHRIWIAAAWYLGIIYVSQWGLWLLRDAEPLFERELVNIARELGAFDD